MKSYAWMAGMLLFALPLEAQEKEKNGVGEIYMGSNLPYNDTPKWKNTIKSGGTLRIGNLRNWSDWKVRAVFTRPMAEIEAFKNKKSIIALFQCAKGPKGKNIVFWNMLRRNEIDDDYAKRNSWGLGTDAKWLNVERHEGMGIRYEQPKPIDIANWESFGLTDGGNAIPEAQKRSAFDRGEKVDSFNLTTLKELVDAGDGKAKLAIYVIVFPYEKMELIKYWGKETVIVEDDDGKKYAVEKDVVTGYKELAVYGKGELLAKATFFIEE